MGAVPHPSTSCQARDRYSPIPAALPFLFLPNPNSQTPRTKNSSHLHPVPVVMTNTSSANPTTRTPLALSHRFQYTSRNNPQPTSPMPPPFPTSSLDPGSLLLRRNTVGSLFGSSTSAGPERSQSFSSQQQPTRVTSVRARPPDYLSDTPIGGNNLFWYCNAWTCSSTQASSRKSMLKV